MTGGNKDLYKKVLEVFCKDVEKRLPLLQTLPETDALPTFVTQVHALKSASASIGASEVSALAMELEAAGNARDLLLIGERLPVFAESLAELVKGIGVMLKSDTALTNETLATDSFVSLFRELDSALKSQKADDIDRILEELIKQPFDSEIKTTLEKISDEVLMAEYDKAGEILGGLIEEATVAK
jgi:HPt (histidine-containing phosphotransfer) domain-containing protein